MIEPDYPGFICLRGYNLVVMSNDPKPSPTQPPLPYGKQPNEQEISTSKPSTRDSWRERTFNFCRKLRSASAANFAIQRQDQFCREVVKESIVSTELSKPSKTRTAGSAKNSGPKIEKEKTRIKSIHPRQPMVRPGIVRSIAVVVDKATSPTRLGLVASSTTILDTYFSNDPWPPKPAIVATCVACFSKPPQTRML